MEEEEISTARPPSPPKKPVRESVDEMDMPSFEKALAKGIAATVKWGKAKLGWSANSEPSGEVSEGTDSTSTSHTNSATQNPSKRETEKEQVNVPGINCQRKALIIPLLVVLDSGKEVPLKALVDTGCENNIVKKGLIPSKYFSPAARKIRFVTANGTTLGGGDKEVKLDLITCANIVGEETKRFLILPTTLYEADISVDVLLSFSWLQEFNLDIKAKDYGLQTHTTPPYFISGITWDTTRTMTESPQVNVLEIRVVPPSALGVHHRGNFQRHFCARPGKGGRVATPS